MTTDQSKPRRYQRRENTIIGTCIFLVTDLFFIFTVNDSSEGIDKGSLTGFTAILGFAALAVCLVLTVRAWRAGIYADDRGITIVNLFWTHRLRWSEIGRFYVGTHRVVKVPASVVELKDGRTIRVVNISPPNPATRPKNREAHNIVAELNRELEAARNTE